MSPSDEIDWITSIRSVEGCRFSACVSEERTQELIRTLTHTHALLHSMALAVIEQDATRSTSVRPYMTLQCACCMW